MAQYPNNPPDAPETRDFSRTGARAGDEKSIAEKSIIDEYVDVSKIKNIFPVAVTAVYLIVSFLTGWWAYTWLLFFAIPIFYTGLPVWNDYRAFKESRSVVDMRGNGPAPGAGAGAPGFRVKPAHLRALIPLCVVPLYFIVSFATGAWALTWIMFLLIPLAEGVIRN
ncbi:MAG: hypothetical protein FWF44_02930 [Defluviitaleaceae bacterium]|nr:hypothetical protein [Defluviitaleaceae bacterium]